MAVAALASVARRISALLGMVAVMVLVLILVWRVYVHHEAGAPHDEPSIVALAARAA